MKIDDTTIAIVKHLRNGRKSFKQIAQSLKLAENTVRSRVRQLTNDRGIDVSPTGASPACPSR